MLTSSELKQIKDYLALYGKKDSQLEAVSVDLDSPEVTFAAKDYLSVVHDDKNKIITIKNLEKVFLLTFLTDEDFREALKGKIPEEMLENACVTTEKLADGAVTTIKLGNSAVTTAKIANGAITNEKIANNTIQGAAFAENSITTDKIVDGTVTGDKLADGSIQSVDIKDNTLSGSKFVDNSISGSKIQDNVIESKHLLDNSIPASKIKDGSIENIDIKDGTLDGSKIAENTIQGSKFADNAITSTKIVDNSINTSKLADNAITTAKIADNSITANKINNSSVTTAKIADESVTEDKLANGAVTTDKLADGVISEIQNITDAVPTEESVKPVQSGGVFTAINNVAFSTSEKVNQVGIDDTPTAGSNNLVKSGGVQNELALGAVYDVSAKNPTAGPNNDGKWGTLSALLSDANLSTLIPASIRKGGMSIKFIQSSDNKYVQYRYMSDDATTTATFTNLDNWLSADGLGQGERYFTKPSTAAKKLVELYLIGLNNSKTYYISFFKRFVYSGSLVNAFQISEIGGGVVAELSDGSENSKEIQTIVQNSSSGISGYVIFNLEDGDSANMTGTLNSAVVSTLDMSPSIKEYINRKEVDEEPTLNSHNLVESGGVVKYLQDSGYVYKGIADLTTVPPTLNNKYRVFYIANQAGTYTNFNSNITLAKGEIAILIYNTGIWYKHPADLASISYIKDTLLLYPKTDWIKDLSSAVIAISGTIITDNIERDVAISKLNSFIKNVESINYSGYLTIAFFGVLEEELYLRLWYYNTLNTVTVSEISSKHDVYVSAQTLRDNNFVIYDSIPYTSSAFKITLDPSVIDFMGGGNYVYNANNQVSFKYSDSGFTPKDVTNRTVIDNGFSKIYKYGLQYAKHLWDYNDALLAIDGLKEEYIYNISKFGYLNSDRFTIVIDYANKNQDNEITAENYIGEISFTAENSIVPLSGVMRVICKNPYGTNVLYVTVDFDKLDNTIYLSQEPKYGSATIVPKYSKYVFAKPIKQFNGYYNASFDRVENNSYVTCIIPLNSECKEAIIRASGFDKNANVLLADSSGRFRQEWGIKNQDNSKYSGNSEIYNCVIDCTGYKFLVVSSYGTDESAFSVQIEGYDAYKAIDSYNSLKCATDINTKDIHLFRSANVNGDFVTSCDKSCRTFQLETSDVANGEITDSETGFVYNNGLLLEVAPDDTKYYYAIAHSTGNNSILWSEKNGVKTVLLRGGATIPQAAGYTSLTWVGANSGDDLSMKIFVKVLPNGSVLVGTDAYGEDTIDAETGKTIVGKYYVIFKIANNGWIPKIITSNQKTYRTNLGYFIKSYGYPTKNNSISLGWNSGRNIIAISEYGFQTPQYWYDKGEDVNGLGVSGKVWVSIDNGDTFYKVFDLDEKINGDADDISDDNWKWCTSYAGRQGMHLHCCYIDQVNNKLWITNGDGRWPDSKNSLYYIDLTTLVNWIVNSGTPVDVTNFNPLYTDNEALPEFREFRMFTSADNNNAVSIAVNYQFYCMIAINNCLVLGNDSARQIFYIIHGDTIIKDSNAESTDMFIDIAYEIDKANPSMSIETFPQLMFKKDENSMIISLWSDKGVYGSWNGVDWSNLKPGYDLGIKFTSYLVKDTDGKFIICTPSTHSQVKLENY